MATTALSEKIFRGTVSEVQRKLREPVVRYELNRPMLEDTDIIVDLTFGPHRRVAHYGAPARPRKIDAIPFQIVVGFRWDGGVRRFIPRSLRANHVHSKNAMYNADILGTIASHSCRVTCDQGSEFSRLPRRYASVQTVNHSVEWVTADGISSNLGEAYNGILKTLGTTLQLFRGNVALEDMIKRWQELAWRVNEGIHERETPLGDKLLVYLNILVEEQRASGAQNPFAPPPSRRTVLVDQIAVPDAPVRARRFPRKTSSKMRSCGVRCGNG